MAETQRTITINLRKDFIKVPKHRRAKRAITNIKNHIMKHMKVEEVKLGKMLNEKIWGHGIQNPPGKITVKAIKEDKIARVELEGFEYKIEKVQTEKSDKPKSLKDKLESKLLSKSEQKEAKKETEKGPTQNEEKTEPKKEAQKKPSVKKKLVEKKE
mgnify:FL=1